MVTKRQLMIEIATRLLKSLQQEQEIKIIDKKYPDKIIKVLDINTDIEVSRYIDLLQYIDDELK